MDQECFTGQHKVLALSLGVICLILAVALPPVMLFINMFDAPWSSRAVQRSARVKQLFLSHGYKD